MSGEAHSTPLSDPVPAGARAAARRLAAELGLRIEVNVAAALHTRGRAPQPAQYFDPISLGGLIVSVATLAWTVYTDLRSRTPQPERGDRHARRPRPTARRRRDGTRAARPHHRGRRRRDAPRSAPTGVTPPSVGRPRPAGPSITGPRAALKRPADGVRAPPARRSAARAPPQQRRPSPSPLQWLVSTRSIRPYSTACVGLEEAVALHVAMDLLDRLAGAPRRRSRRRARAA